MQKDELQDDIRAIEEFCASNDIALAYGEGPDFSDVDLDWDDDEQGTGIAKTLALVKKAGVRLLHLEREYNDLEMTTEDIEEYLSYQEDEEDRAAVMKDITLVQKNHGQLVTIMLCFYYQGGCYIYQKDASWERTHWELVRFFNKRSDDELDEEEDENSDESNDAEDPAEQRMQEQTTASLKRLAGEINGSSSSPQQPSEPNRLTDEMIEAQARALIQNERYLCAKTKTERRTVAAHLLKEGDIIDRHDRWQIEDRAEEIYQVEVVPKQEQDLVDKIKVYLKTTEKPTMTDFARRIKMDVRRIGPFYVRAKEE